MEDIIIIKYIENENEICELYSIGEKLYTHKEDIFGDQEPLIFGHFSSLASFALTQIKRFFNGNDFVFEKLK